MTAFKVNWICWIFRPEKCGRTTFWQGGQHFRVACPAGGRLFWRVWNTDFRDHTSEVHLAFWNPSLKRSAKTIDIFKLVHVCIECTEYSQLNVMASGLEIVLLDLIILMLHCPITKRKEQVSYSIQWCLVILTLRGMNFDQKIYKALWT